MALIDLIGLWDALAGRPARAAVSISRLKRKAGEHGQQRTVGSASRRLFLCALHVLSASVEDEVCYLAHVVLKELHFRVHDFQEEFRF